MVTQTLVFEGVAARARESGQRVADAPTRVAKLRHICARCPTVGSRADCPLACGAYTPPHNSDRPAELQEQNPDFERICAAPEAAAVYLAYCC